MHKRDSLIQKEKIKAWKYLEQIPERLRQFYVGMDCEFIAFRKKFGLPKVSRLGFHGICKSYILWAYFYEHKIHFILNGINMRYVTQKDDPYERQNKAMMEFDVYYCEKNCRLKNITTNSELRFIYRNWRFLKDTVIFWQTDPVTSQLKKRYAPWEEKDEITFSHDMKRERSFGFIISGSDVLEVRVFALWQEYGLKFNSKDTCKQLQDKIQEKLKTSVLAASQIAKYTFCLYHQFKKCCNVTDQMIEEAVNQL